VAQIDPALFRGALLQATADLANAKANVARRKRIQTKRKLRKRKPKPTTSAPSDWSKSLS